MCEDLTWRSSTFCIMQGIMIIPLYSQFSLIQLHQKKKKESNTTLHVLHIYSVSGAHQSGGGRSTLFFSLCSSNGVAATAFSRQ